MHTLSNLFRRTEDHDIGDLFAGYMHTFGMIIFRTFTLYFEVGSLSYEWILFAVS